MEGCVAPTGCWEPAVSSELSCSLAVSDKGLECLLLLGCGSCPRFSLWDLSGGHRAAVWPYGSIGLSSLVLNELGDLPVISVFPLLHSLLYNSFFHCAKCPSFHSFSYVSPLTSKSHFLKSSDPWAAPAQLTFTIQMI